MTVDSATDRSSSAERCKILTHVDAACVASTRPVYLLRTDIDSESAALSNRPNGENLSSGQHKTTVGGPVPQRRCRRRRRGCRSGDQGRRRTRRTQPESPRAYVKLIDPAVADLVRPVAVNPQVVRWALKKMLLLERDPTAGRPLLGDLLGWRKAVVGDRGWRIVWRVTNDTAGNQLIDIAEVWAAGARANAEVYQELSERAAALGDSPTATALNEISARLGRTGEYIDATPEPVDDPVPSWLADRLHHQAHMSRPDIAKLTGAQAMQAWEHHITHPNPEN